MYFNLSTLGEGKKCTQVIDIATNEQNSMSRASLLNLKDILDEAQKDSAISAVLFTSSNQKFFSNGLDAENVINTPADKLVEEVGEIVLFFAHLLRFDKPVITEVTGYAMGGGAVITVASDFKYMLDGKARISFSEVLVGLPLPGIFIDKIVRTVHAPYVNAICFGENYRAAEAKTIGLIDEIAPDAESLRQLSLKKIDQLNRIPLSALMRTKQAYNAPVLERAEIALKHTYESFINPTIIANFIDSMTSLKEKRRPRYID